MNRLISPIVKFVSIAVAFAGLTTPATAVAAGNSQKTVRVAAAPAQMWAPGGGNSWPSFPTVPYYGGYGNFFPGSGYWPSSYPQVPKYWWVSPYPIDESQDFHNPNAGYSWDTVMTLVLSSTPAKARVTLDGIFVGTANQLGPFQLPRGSHTLRVEASGYEPSETVLRVEQPELQQLEVSLKPTGESGSKR